MMAPRLAALDTLSTLALGAGQAWAAPPPVTRDRTPPGRVGRVARLAGTVSQQAAAADPWSPATLNAPVASGDVFWTEPVARADIQAASNRLTLAPQTELDAGDATHPTLVTVVEGAAQITGAALSLRIGPSHPAPPPGGNGTHRR